MMVSHSKSDDKVEPEVPDTAPEAKVKQSVYNLVYFDYHKDELKLVQVEDEKELARVIAQELTDDDQFVVVRGEFFPSEKRKNVVHVVVGDKEFEVTKPAKSHSPVSPSDS